MKTRTVSALTLVQLLTVVVVILLLVGIVASTSIAGVREANMADATSRLRQIGVALQLYADDQGEYPLDNLDPLVRTRLIPETGLLRIPSDPFVPAYASRLYQCLERQLAPSRVPEFPTSFEDIFYPRPNPDGTYRQAHLCRVLEVDPNPGIVATRVLGDLQNGAGSDCFAIPMAYQGRIIRLRLDGSVKRDIYIDLDQQGRRRHCIPAVFTNLAHDKICGP